MSKFNNAKALALGRGLTVLTSLILLPYLSRSLPIEIYGSYGQVIFYIEIFKAFALLGLNKVVFIFLSKNSNLSEVYSNNIFASLLAGFVLAIICALSSSTIALLFDNPVLIIPICIYSISIPFDTCFLCYSSLLINENKSSLLSWIAVVSNVFRAVVLVIIIYNVKNLVFIFTGLAILSVLQCWSIVYFSKIFVSLKLVKYKYWMTQIKQGLPLGLTSILGTLYYLTDSIVVSTILTNSDYAILRNGAFQIPFISTLYSIVGLVLMKDISEFVQQNDYSKIIHLKSRAILISMLIIFPVTIFLIVFSKYWIPFLFSSVYAGSVVIFMIYNIMTLFRITDYESIIVLTENGNKLPLVYLSSFVINILLSIPLTYALGPVGSAMASILSFVILVGILTRINLNLLGAKISDFVSLKQFLFVLVPSSVFSILAYSFINFVPPFQVPVPLWVGLVITMLAITYHFILKYGDTNTNDLKAFFGIIPVPIFKNFLTAQYCK